MGVCFAKLCFDALKKQFCVEILSMSRCYRHMKIVRPNRTATVTYKVDSNEVNTNSKVNILDNKATNVQSIKMTMRNVLVDSNCRLNGQ